MNDMSNSYDCKVIDQVVKYFLGDSYTAMCTNDLIETIQFKNTIVNVYHANVFRKTCRIINLMCCYTTHKKSLDFYEIGVGIFETFCNRTQKILPY